MTTDKPKKDTAALTKKPRARKPKAPPEAPVGAAVPEVEDHIIRRPVIGGVERPGLYDWAEVTGGPHQGRYGVVTLVNDVGDYLIRTRDDEDVLIAASPADTVLSTSGKR